MTALRTLLAELVDYAGLFPPTALPMADAVGNYERYRNGAESWALGRFIVPLAKMHEVPADFPLSVLVTPDEVASLDARVTTIEVKASTPDDVARIALGGRTAYVEITDLALLEPIATHGLRAKIRTGGVTAEAFPSASRVAEFLRACAAHRVAFKATAGLHHPLRCVRPLTYEADAPTGTMHGFLNVFLAAALLEDAEAVLMENDPRAFAIEGDAIVWRGKRVTTSELAALRERAISFGSCSFEEPLADLRELGWL